MKCICGHVCDNSHEDPQHNWFVKLRVLFTTNEQLGLYPYAYDSVRQNALYVCPKCGTVRAERD